MFRAKTEWIGLLELPASERGFTLHHGSQLEHSLGFENAPMYFIDQAPSPDDPLSIEPQENGRPIELGAKAADPALSGWLPAEHRDAGLALAANLPAGQYWWLRSRVEPYEPATVLMGNELVARDPHVLELARSDEYYAAIIGQHRGRSPVLDQPLLGVPVLNYAGTEAMNAVLFFPCSRSDGAPRSERVLVIPASGGLILDNLGRFSEENRQRSLAKWSAVGARKLAEILAV